MSSIERSRRVVDAMGALMTAIRRHGESHETLREILERLPADHIAHQMARVTCKCVSCGAFQPLSQVLWSGDVMEPGCERCEAVGSLMLVEDDQR